MSERDLYDASGKGDLTEVERLLDAGADMNWRNDVRDILYYIIVVCLCLFFVNRFYNLNSKVIYSIYAYSCP